MSTPISDAPGPAALDGNLDAQTIANDIGATQKLYSEYLTSALHNQAGKNGGPADSLPHLKIDGNNQIISWPPSSEHKESDIPSWQQRKEQKEAEEAQKAKEAAEAKAAAEAQRAAEAAQKRHDDSMDKAVKAGAFPKDVLEELQKEHPAKGVRELVDKVLEKYGGAPAESHLDGFVHEEKEEGFVHYTSHAKMVGADEKLAKMSPDQAAKTLKDWVNGGTNPFDKGGALEQTMLIVHDNDNGIYSRPEMHLIQAK